MSDIRKIPFSLEGPLDILFITISEKLNPFFKKLNLKPNHITTISVLFKIITLISFYYDKYVLSAVSLLLAYMFDCCDGSYARKYNMTTRLGDLYDHISDFLYYTIFLILFICKEFKYKLLLGFSIVSFGMLSCMYLICSEEYMNKDNKNRVSIINLFNFYKGNPDKCLKFTKFFSSGSFNTLLFITLIIYKFFI